MMRPYVEHFLNSHWQQTFYSAWSREKHTQNSVKP